jgi:electron transfer flavoprotein beta subunit
MVLAEAIKRLGQDEEIGMVICGKQTIDGDTAQVGPGIATRLKYSQLTLVDQIQNVDLASKKITVRRKLEGRHEIVEAPVPALLTVVREINHLRYPTVPMRLSAEEVEVKLWDNKAMQLSDETIGLKGSPTQVRRIFSPERPKGEILGNGTSKPEEAARLLVDTLIERDIISL